MDDANLKVACFSLSFSQNRGKSDTQKYDASQNLGSSWGNIAPAEVLDSHLSSGKC